MELTPREKDKLMGFNGRVISGKKVRSRGKT